MTARLPRFPAPAGSAAACRCAGWSRRSTCGRRASCCRCSSRRASASRSRCRRCPACVQHTRESLRKAAAEAVDGRRRRPDPVRHPGGQGRPRLGGRRPCWHRSAGAARPGGRGRRRHRADGRPVPGRVHRPRPLRAADRGRRGGQRRDAGAVRVDRGRAGGGGRARRRAERDDGRPGRSDPDGTGRRRAIRDVAICAYSAKYASAFYGPFREAAECAPQFGDRAAYQQDPAAAKDALREAMLDAARARTSSWSSQRSPTWTSSVR